jgi:hypothetical protein
VQQEQAEASSQKQTGRHAAMEANALPHFALLMECAAARHALGKPAKHAEHCHQAAQETVAM